MNETKTPTPTPPAPAAGSGKRCPFCGGTTGYRYIATIRGEQWMEWDGTAVSFEDTHSKHGAHRCQDCNRIVRKNPNQIGGGQ